MSDPLARVLKGNLCAGCGACAALAPGDVTMEVAPPGFLRPKAARALTVEEGRRFEAVCPGLGIDLDPAGRASHPLWGPYEAVRTGWAADPDLRHVGSSGGALSAALIHLLESGAADAVIETGAGDPAYANRTVVSRTRDEVMAAAGSRYAASAPLADLDAMLAAGERLVFVGKPCDVAALRGLAKVDPRIDAQIVLMVSFFCGGVPAHQGAREVLAALGVAEAELAAFRYRGNGWPGFATATRRDGSAERMSYPDSWGKILTQHVQARCKICPDGTGGLADLVCADAWECDEKGYPIFEEREGRSLIVARTKAGEAALTAAVEAGALTLETGDEAVATAEEITLLQPGQRIRKGLVASRLAALRLMGRPAPRYRGFHLGEAARAMGVRDNLRNFLGMIRRIATGRV